MCIKYKQEALTIIFSPVKSQQSTVTKTLGPGAKWVLEPGFALILGLLLATVMVLDKLIYLSELLVSISVKYHLSVICYWWCLVAKSCPILCDPMDCSQGLQPTRLLCPWDFPGKNTGAGCHFLTPGDLPNPRIEPMSPALANGFFTTESQGNSFVTECYIKMITDPGDLK